MNNKQCHYKKWCKKGNYFFYLRNSTTTKLFKRSGKVVVELLAPEEPPGPFSLQSRKPVATTATNQALLYNSVWRSNKKKLLYLSISTGAIGCLLVGDHPFAKQLTILVACKHHPNEIRLQQECKVTWSVYHDFEKVNNNIVCNIKYRATLTGRFFYNFIK